MAIPIFWKGRQCSLVYLSQPIACSSKRKRVQISGPNKREHMNFCPLNNQTFSSLSFLRDKNRVKVSQNDQWCSVSTFCAKFRRADRKDPIARSSKGLFLTMVILLILCLLAIKPWTTTFVLSHMPWPEIWFLMCHQGGMGESLGCSIIEVRLRWLLGLQLSFGLCFTSNRNRPLMAWVPRSANSAILLKTSIS